MFQSAENAFSMMMFLIIAAGIVLALAAWLIPYDWWRRPLGGFMTVSLRTLCIRIFAAVFILAQLSMAVLFLPLMAAVLIVIFLVQAVFRRLTGKRDDAPVSGIILLIVLFTLFMYGLLAPLRLLSIFPYFVLGRPAGGQWESLAVGTSGITMDLFLGVLGILFVATWLVIDAVWRLRQARQAGNLATSTVRSLAQGLVELRGTVRPREGNGDGRTVAQMSWNMLSYFSPFQRIELFYVDDGTGRVLVDATGCRVRSGWIANILSIFGTREIVLTKRVLRDETTDAVARSLREGDRVYLIGNAEENPLARRDAQGADRLVVRPAERTTWSSTLWTTLFGAAKPPKGKDIHDVFFLTDGDETDARKHILKGFRTVLLFGLLWVAASGALLWSTTLPDRREPPLDSWRPRSWQGPEPHWDRNVVDHAQNRQVHRFEKWLANVGPGSINAIPLLAEAMEVKNSVMKEQAASKMLPLIPMAPEQARAAVPQLIANLSWYDAKVVQISIIALGAMGQGAADAVPALIEQLRCRKTNTYEITCDTLQWEAARALGAMGPAAGSAVPALRELLDHRAAYVRTEAERALRLIGEEGGQQR